VLRTTEFACGKRNLLRKLNSPAANCKLQYRVLLLSVIERQRDNLVAPQEQFSYRAGDNLIADIVGNFVVVRQPDFIIHQLV
jgi:hypothetical protein